MHHVHPRLYAPHLPPIYIPINRTGSVGKTTFGYNVSVQAAQRGRKGLYIDADLQSDASYWSAYDGDQLPAGVVTVHHVLLGRAKLSEATVPARTRIAAGDSEDSFQLIPNLDLVRGDENMSQADTEIASDPGMAMFWLQKALKKEIPEGKYDFIWIDPPASLGTLTVSLLIAATEVVTCLKPTRKELRGAAALMRRVEEAREGYDHVAANPHCHWMFMNEAKQHVSQGKFYMNMQTEARQMYGDRILPMLPSSTLWPEAFDAQEPMAFWAPNSPQKKAIDACLDMMGFTEAA